MKKLLFILLTLVAFASSNSASAQQEISSPLYLGFILVDEPTIETMSEVCDYYGLQAIPTTDGYTTYRHSDGTIFRFKQTDDKAAGMNGRLLEIQTPASSKEIQKALSSLQYKKSGTAKVTINTDATDGTPIKTVSATTYDHGSPLARYFLRAYIISFNPSVITFRYVDTL